LDAAFDRLGIKDAGEQERLLATELHGGVDDLSAIRRSFVGWRGGAVLLAIMVGILLVTAAVVSSKWAGPALAGGVSAVAGAIALATWWVDRARKGLSSLRAFVDGINQRSVQETEEGLSTKLGELRRAEADEQVLQSQLRDVVARAGELGTELAEASPGQ